METRTVAVLIAFCLAASFACSGGDGNGPATLSPALQSLEPSSGALDPVFGAGTTDYTVLTTGDSFRLRATPESAGAVLSLDGVSLAPGSWSLPRELLPGTNLFLLRVADADAFLTFSRRYRVAVVRSRPDNAELYSLTLSEKGLTPVFAPALTDYTLGVSGSVSNLVVQAVPMELLATASIGGVIVPAQGLTVPLSFGSNTINLLVTAADGVQTRTYRITVTRAALSTETALASLSLGGGSKLVPDFASGIVSYNATAVFSQDVVSITAVPLHPKASVAVSGNTLAPGPSTNTVTVRVTAEDGIAIRDYVITVIRYGIFPANWSFEDGIGYTTGSGATLFSWTRLDQVTTWSFHHETGSVPAYNGNNYAWLSNLSTTGREVVSSPFPIVATLPISLSAYFRVPDSPAQTQVAVKLVYLTNETDPAPVVPSYYNSNVSAQNDWVVYRGARVPAPGGNATTQIPTNARFARVYIRIRSANSTNNLNKVYFDDVRITQ